MQVTVSHFYNILTPILVFLTYLAQVSATGERIVSYHGYSILKIKNLFDIQTEEDLYRLLYQDDYQDEIDLEILEENKKDGEVHVMVSPNYKERLFKRIKNIYPYETLTEDLSREIGHSSLRSLVRLAEGDVTFQRYMSIEEINKYLEKLSKRYPSKVLLNPVEDTKVDERPIYRVRISNGIGDMWPERNGKRPIIFIESGIHAREWISPAATLYIIDKLINTDVLTGNIEWHIFPVTNPDGYAHSWSSDRMWRKNRVDINHPRCRGIDLNRNFEAFYRPSPPRKKCRPDYSGTKFFSEEETIAIKKAVWPVKERIKAYLSVHSYGQYLLFPPGTTRANVKASEIYKHRRLANSIAKEIKAVQNVTYTTGTPYELLYEVGGASDDWAYFNAKINISMTMELRDRGIEGFLLSPKYIPDVGEDLWIVLQMLAGKVLKNDVYAFRRGIGKLENNYIVEY